MSGLTPLQRYDMPLNIAVRQMPNETESLSFMSIIIRVFLLIGVAIWVGWTFLLFAASGLSDSSTEPATGPMLAWFSIPCLLLLCFFLTFIKRKKQAVQVQIVKDATGK
jgi:hypothetical protein